MGTPLPTRPTATMNGLVRLVVTVVMWFVLTVFWPTTGFAQPTNNGLPGGPLLGDNFQQIDKIETICDKCKPEEAAFHSQVDVYNAARTTSDEQAATVRQLANDFLTARAEYARLNGIFQELSTTADDLLFNRGDRSMGDYYESRDARDYAETPMIEARSQQDKARAALDDGLRRLEQLRLDVMVEMRAALALERAMTRCEFACEIEDLNLDARDLVLPTPPVGISAADIPTPENFVGIVAKCATCQPHAEQVNLTRSHRRSFASSAQSLFASMTANQATLDRLQREDTVLQQEERELYRSLLRFFTARGPGEDAPNLDRDFDNIDQREAEQALRGLSQRRAQNARDRAGLIETIAEQSRNLLVALTNYHAHTVLLDAALQRLADCEKTCRTDVGGGGTGVDPMVDPNYPQPENVDPILAACPECQPIADAVVQTLSECRRVANDIQSEAWLLNGRRASLERWEVQEDALGREERALSQQLLLGNNDQSGERAILDRLFKIEDARTELLIDILWAQDEISRLEPQLEAHLAEHQVLTTRAGALRLQLTECEAGCNEPTDDTGGLGRVGFFDPTYPQPISFYGVVTDCAPCQTLADQLNTLLGERYTLASDIQSTVARLAHNRPLLEERRATLTELLAREQELNPIWSSFEEGEDRAAATEELNRIDLARRIAENDIAALSGLNEADEAALATMLLRHTELNQRISDLVAQLAGCEKQCADPDTGGTGLVLPEDDGFVSTDCPPCEALASMVNDAVGTLKGVERELATAQARLAVLRNDAETRQSALDEVLARETVLNTETLSGVSEARAAEIDAELHGVDAERNALTDAQETEGADQELAETAVTAAQARVDELTQLVADLKAQLAECEKQCADPDTGGTGLVLPEDDGFVSTDCPPCEALASMVNDAVGTLKGAERELATAQAAFDTMTGDLAEKNAAKSAAQDMFSDAMIEKSRLEAAGADASAQSEIIDTNLNRAADLLTEIEGLEIELLDAGDRTEELQAQMTRLQQQLQAIRDQLAECEQQCAEDGGATSTDDGQVSTGSTPNFHLGKLQPKTCRGGRSCTFEISATNRSEQAYNGPLFLAETGRVASNGNGAIFDGWHCSPARAGGSLCLHTEEIASGSTVGFNVQVNLPNRVAQGAENCVAVTFASDERVLLQMVQVGLAARGFKPGTADGIAGRRTSAAIAEFAMQNDLDIDQNDPTAVYQALFGVTPVTTTEIATTACVTMDITRPINRPRTSVPTPRTAPPSTSTPDAPTPKTVPRTPKPRFKIIIDLGLFGGSSDGHRTSPTEPIGGRD